MAENRGTMKQSTAVIMALAAAAAGGSVGVGVAVDEEETNVAVVERGPGGCPPPSARAVAEMNVHHAVMPNTIRWFRSLNVYCGWEDVDGGGATDEDIDDASSEPPAISAQSASTARPHPRCSGTPT